MGEPNLNNDILSGFWYLAAPAKALGRGRMLAKKIFGQPLLFGRTDEGEVFALRDICPHRGIPLHYGSFDGREITCCYHGWTFAPDGRCTAIPSLVPEQQAKPDRIRVGRYPCREVQGNIWVYYSEKPIKNDSDLPPPPQVPGFAEAAPQVSLSSIFPCDADHAAFGLMDPTHAAFVHVSWWWKREARKLRQKEKHFEPVPLGWRMKRHRLPPENRAYRLLGREVHTEITYSLPGLRVEQVEGERHSVVALTAITPIEANRTEVHQCLYWTMPWLTPVRPVVRHLASVFLGQDRQVVVRQQEGLAYDPTLMLIDDADTQAKWFARLKQEWQSAQAEGRTFANPIEARTLRWRS